VPLESQAAPGERPVTATAAKVVTLEFDTPPDFVASSAKGAAHPSFQVGFFAGDQLVRAIEIPPASTRVKGNKVQLDVPLIPVPARESNVTLRVRTLTSGSLGAWSASAGSVTLPVVEQRVRAARTGPARTGAPRAERQARRKGGARQVTMADLEGRTTLTDALTARLDGGLSAAEVVSAFARVQDVAVAVALSRANNLSLARLSAAVQASPTKSVAEALKVVQPSLDADKALKAATSEAKALLGRRKAPPQ
jgi:hypothetical protein